jgi:hypothetical protein
MSVQSWVKDRVASKDAGEIAVGPKIFSIVATFKSRTVRLLLHIVQLVDLNQLWIQASSIGFMLQRDLVPLSVNLDDFRPRRRTGRQREDPRWKARITF